jgi:hypothetical protein
LPDDVDWIATTDADWRYEDGWGDKVKLVAATTPATRVSYTYVFSHLADGSNGTLLAHRSPGAAEARRVELLATRDERARRLERLRHFEPPVIVLAPPPPAAAPAPLPPPAMTPPSAVPAHASAPPPASPAASDAKILTIDEVMARLKIGRNRVFELLKEGKLKRSKRIAGRTHLTLQSVEKFEEQVVGRPPKSARKATSAAESAPPPTGPLRAPTEAELRAQRKALFGRGARDRNAGAGKRDD